MAEQEKEILMKKDKECKHSVRYASSNPESPLSTVYVSRKFSSPMPEEIVVTVAKAQKE